MQDYSVYTDEELICRLRDGEETIMDYIMKKYKNLVRKNAQNMYILGAEEQDLIQEGMIGLFKAVRDFKTEKEVSFFAFAEICITRQLYSALEASNRKKHIPLNTYVSFSNQTDYESVLLEQMITQQTISPEQMMIEQEGIKEFFEKLDKKLSPMERKVLYLYLEGHSYTQIAEILSKPAKAIDNTLQRIRAKVKLLKEEI